MTTADVGVVADRAVDLAADGALTVRAAVEFSGLTRSRLFELMATSQVVSAKIGWQRLLSKRSLVDFLAAQLAAAGRS